MNSEAFDNFSRSESTWSLARNECPGMNDMKSESLFHMLHGIKNNVDTILLRYWHSDGLFLYEKEGESEREREKKNVVRRTGLYAF